MLLYIKVFRYSVYKVIFIMKKDFLFIHPPHYIMDKGSIMLSC